MLQLFLNGIDVVLPDDIEIDIERTSPVWNESGTFSYPFPVPYYPNVAIFGNLHSPESDSRAVDFSFPFELYVCGILLLRGTATVDTGLFDDEENVPLTLSSGKNTFYQNIEGMKCTDLKMNNPEAYSEGTYNSEYRYWEWKTKYNIQNPYSRVGPRYTYFNPTIITNTIEVLDNVKIIGEGYDRTETDYIDSTNRPTRSNNSRGLTKSVSYEGGEKKNVTPILNYDQGVGICFFLGYFLECLFAQFQTKVNRFDLDKYDDFNRLVMFTTMNDYIFSEIANNKQYAYPTSKNFPDVEISKVVNSITNGFGVKLIFDEINNSVDAILFKEVLSSTKVYNIDCILVKKPSKIQQEKNKINIRYTKTGDTKFDYFEKKGEDSYHSGIHFVDNYNDIIYYMYDNNGNPALNETNTVLYADRNTGNTYRIKVDSKNFDKPVLFEVGDYTGSSFGEGNDELDLVIEFEPIITNQINIEEVLKQFNYIERTAIYVDVNLTYGYTYSGRNEGGRGSSSKLYTYYLKLDELRKREQPFIVGVMRGSGSSAAIIDTTEQTVGDPNVLGGSTYVMSAGDNPAFNSDSIDLFGRYYDYNGQGPGLGYDTDKIFSLKIDAGKPIDDHGKPFVPIEAPNRGLYQTFLKEYVHFLLNRKTVQMELLMTVSQLSFIDWKEKYRIGDSQYEGFFNKLSFKVSKNGISAVTAEIYMI